jgi:hypothetical protein
MLERMKIGVVAGFARRLRSRFQIIWRSSDSPQRDCAGDAAATCLTAQIDLTFRISI